MTFVTVRCLSCDSEQVVKRGKTSRGKQRVAYLGPADNYLVPKTG
jgi:InsA-like protein